MLLNKLWSRQQTSANELCQEQICVRNKWISKRNSAANNVPLKSMDWTFPVLLYCVYRSAFSCGACGMYVTRKEHSRRDNDTWDSVNTLIALDLRHLSQCAGFRTRRRRMCTKQGCRHKRYTSAFWERELQRELSKRLLWDFAFFHLMQIQISFCISE